MRNAFTLTLATLVAGIFGFFLRWLQTINGFTEAGVSIPGAKISVVFLLYSLAALLCFLLEERLIFRKISRSHAAFDALRTPGFPAKALVWAAGGLLSLGSLIYMFVSGDAAFPLMQRLTGALGILAGLCLPLLILKRDVAEQREAKAMAEARKAAEKAARMEELEKKDPEAAKALKKQEEAENKGKKREPLPFDALASLMPVLFACMWMVTAYREECENPILWAYVPGLLAIMLVLVGFYYISAYSFHSSRPGRGLLAMQCAGYLSICTLIDGHSLGETLMYMGCAGAMLVFQYTVLHNGINSEQ